MITDVQQLTESVAQKKAQVEELDKFHTMFVLPVVMKASSQDARWIFALPSSQFPRW